MDEELKVAKEAAIEAGKIALSAWGKTHKNTNKGDGDFATEVDYKAEKKIKEILKINFPGYGFLAEESGYENEKAEHLWVIDPLDGTIVYAHGLPTFAVSIGLLENNTPVLGVINAPALDMFFWAVKSSGSYLNGTKISVSKRRKLSDSLVGVDIQRPKKRVRDFKKTILPLVPEIISMPIIGSAVLGSVLVSSGIYDAYLHSAYPWDYVASSVIVEEAGGKITDYKGFPVDWLKKEIELIVSNGLIHEEIVKLIGG
jgi:myo-inositol-1(or 4)-monophosphatase